MTLPELMTHAEERQLAEMIETDIRYAIEERNGLHEVAVTDEGEETE